MVPSIKESEKSCLWNSWPFGRRGEGGLQVSTRPLFALIVLKSDYQSLVERVLAGEDHMHLVGIL